MNNLLQANPEMNYHFWIKHEVLSIKEICMLSLGLFPDQMNIIKYSLAYLFQICPRRSMILSGIKGGEIKAISEFDASPLECFLYLKKKGFGIPDQLDNILTNELESIQMDLNRKILRNKESYLRKDTRGDDRILEATLRTLLDLYPNYPKDRIIHLLPVQEYANGKKHSDQFLKSIITRIEDGKRPSGNVSNVKEIEEKIPKKWLSKTC